MFLFRKVKQLAFWSYWSSVVSNNNKRISASEDSFVLQWDIYMPVAPDMYLNFFRSWSPTRIRSFRSDN